MKKVFEIYDRVAEWLCSFDSDKYVHLLFGLLISFAVAWVFILTTAGATKPVCAMCGVIAAVLFGLLKEIADFFRNKPFEGQDWLFTSVGGAMGAMMFLV